MSLWRSGTPAECEEFEAEIRQALAHADADFDLGHVDAVLDRWWGIVTMCANPLTEQERELIVQARARPGLRTGLLQLGECVPTELARSRAVS